MSSGPSQAQPQITKGFTDVLAQAVLDDQFRALLYSDQATALQGFQLSANDLEALNSITPEMMNGFASQYRQQTPVVAHAWAVFVRKP